MAEGAPGGLSGGRLNRTPPAGKDEGAKSDQSKEDEEAKTRLTITIICVVVVLAILALGIVVLVLLRRRQLRRRREKKEHQLQNKYSSGQKPKRRRRNKSRTARADRAVGRTTKLDTKESMPKAPLDSMTRAPIAPELGISERPYSHSAATAKSASSTKLSAKAAIVGAPPEPSIITAKKKKLAPIVRVKPPPTGVRTKSEDTKPPTMSTTAIVSTGTARTQKSLSSASALPPTSFGARSVAPPGR